MPDYHVFVRTEPAKEIGKGADREDVISIRPADARVTDHERKTLLILKVTMTEQEAEDFHKSINPAAHYIPITEEPDPIKEPDANAAWWLAYKEELDRLSGYQRKVSFSEVEIATKLTDIDNPVKIVKPIAIDTVKIIDKLETIEEPIKEVRL